MASTNARECGWFSLVSLEVPSVSCSLAFDLLFALDLVKAFCYTCLEHLLSFGQMLGVVLEPLLFRRCILLRRGGSRRDSDEAKQGGRDQFVHFMFRYEAVF